MVEDGSTSGRNNRVGSDEDCQLGREKKNRQGGERFKVIGIGSRLWRGREAREGTCEKKNLGEPSIVEECGEKRSPSKNRGEVGLSRLSFSAG